MYAFASFFLWDSDLDSHQVAHTGAIPALIEFTEQVNVSWVVDANTQVHIGSMKLSGLSAKHGRALVNQNTTFIIDDEVAFGQFSGHLITSQNFTWRLQSPNLRVHALKFPVAKGVKFDKLLTLKGRSVFDPQINF